MVSTAILTAMATTTVATLTNLVAEVVAMTNNPNFDLTGDGHVDVDDVDAWLAEAGASELPSGQPYLRGDANLDGIVDGLDFIAWNAHKFTTAPLGALVTSMRMVWWTGRISFSGIRTSSRRRIAFLPFLSRLPACCYLPR